MLLKKYVSCFLIACSWLVNACENTLNSPVALTPSHPNNIFLQSTETPLPTKLSTMTSTPTATPTIQPTLIYLILPTKDPSLAQEPTITAPPTRNPPLVLPGNLQTEEYEISFRDFFDTAHFVEERHFSEMGGWYFWPRGGALNGKLLNAREEIVVIDKIDYAQVYATLDGADFFRTDCGRVKVQAAVVTAWVYQNHWAIQAYCQDRFDIFLDGVSLNESNDYQSSFGFQVLGGKPFYMFKKDDQVGLFYDDKEVFLGYDSVVLAYCCTIDIHPPMHYENMIVFAAEKGEKLYYVAIGLFK